MSRLSTLCLLLALFGPPLYADSLYTSGQYRSMFADRKARAVGDVVTVLITENTVAVQDGNSEAQRRLESSAAGGGGNFLLRLIPKGRLSGSTSQQGSGKTSRSSRLDSTITCRVTSVAPGGLLGIRGERLLRINADTQTLQLTGLVRPEDVAPDNTVPSSAVAEARIAVLGKGPINRHVKPGVLSRIFEFLF